MAVSTQQLRRAVSPGSTAGLVTADGHDDAAHPADRLSDVIAI
jgi:hypothetical protein